MSHLSNLFRLQQIDSQLDLTFARLSNLEHELADNIALVTAQQVVDQAEEHYKSATKNLREAENKSYDTRIKIELSEKSLYGGKIQNPKELQDLQNEIASLKRHMVTLEDKQLEAMMEVEEADSNLRRVNTELQKAQSTQIEHRAVLNGEKTNLISKIERLQSERKATLPTIPAPELGLYEQLRKSRNGVAVVKISSRACTACGTTLTAAMVQSTQTPGQLIRCPTCGRILYPG